MDSKTSQQIVSGPWDNRSNEMEEQLPSALVATMWLCLLQAVEQRYLDELGDCNMAVAFDLGIAVQVAEEESIPLADLMVEVFEFYNEKLELSLPSTPLAVQVARNYETALQTQHLLH
ncbi:hypothetical protein [Ferrimonas marina]|uniref:Uncharacterized protein n=1 Tax=Ferrimonas marina TaxID=299255 RepID=A0A1M5P8D3_9GAMM|nr:hypothetical protein [Ferrimonas marina]SHG97957.1 hypothetical protein SAMN02745129_1325 [Ferrimonas marina]